MVDAVRSQFDLSSRARLAVFSAHHIARSEPTWTVRADHMLAALLEHPHRDIRAILTAAEIDVGSLSRLLRSHRPENVTDLEVIVSTDATSLLDIAETEAKRCDSTVIDEPHIFIALMQFKGIAQDHLQAAGLSADSVRKTLQDKHRQRQALPADDLVANSLPHGLLGITADGTLSVPRESAREIRNQMRKRSLRALLRATEISFTFFLLVFFTIIGCALLAFAEPSVFASRALIVLVIVCGWITSVCVHEFGHAAAAFLGGDRIVEGEGYLRFDPRAYIDDVFSIAMPLAGLLMGGIPLPGGSVRIRRHLLFSKQWDLAVNIAGPVGTLICLTLVSSPFWLGATERWPERAQLWTALGGLTLVITSALILTLLPIPPLDGFNIVSHWLPSSMATSARGLGWMPIIVLYMMLSKTGTVSDAFWTLGYSIMGLFNVDSWYGLAGVSTLNLN